MSFQMPEVLSKLVGPAVVSIFASLLAVLGRSPMPGDQPSPMQERASSSHHQVVVLLDTNPHQKKVLSVELALAKGVIERVAQSGNAFSVITFSSQRPTLLKSDVAADEAITAIQDVTLEQTREKYFSVDFYDALRLAIDQFTDDDARSKSVLIISDAKDYFPRKTFKETVVRARQLQAACDIAIVADRSSYGGRVQRYGYELWGLARKTHGQYIEVGGKQKKVARSVERLSEGILSRRPGSK